MHLQESPKTGPVLETSYWSSLHALWLRC